jgi:hypothetical protein
MDGRTDGRWRTRFDSKVRSTAWRVGVAVITGGIAIAVADIGMKSVSSSVV